MDAHKRQITEIDGFRLKEDTVYHELASLDDLKRQTSRTNLRDAMIEDVKKNNKNAPPIDLTITFLKMPFVAGSEDSKRVLSVLDSLGESEVYETTFIQSFLDYKWFKVRYLAYLMMLIYFGFLMNMLHTESWIAILIWLIYFSLILVYKIATSGQDDDSFCQ
jgi:hypothetical protein